MKASSQEHSPPASGQRSPHRRRKLMIAAVFTAITPFALLETGLRLLSIGDEAIDLHDGFGHANALFVLDDKAGVWRTNVARQRFFAAQEFPAAKPEKDFRIFCLGGSTVQGRPYEPATSFGKWLELELAVADPDHHYRTVNCGGISYASYRLQSVLAEVLQHQPDLIILATGHNEFLEDRTYAKLKARSALRMRLENAARSLRTVMLLRQLTGGAAPVEPTSGDTGSATIEARLDSQSGYASYHRDELWHDDVAQRFSQACEEMVDLCRDAQVPVVFVGLGSNLRDCPPFKSQHRADLSTEQQLQWQQLFEAGGRIEIQNPETALTHYREAQQIDDRHALLHFRMARCLDQLQQWDDANAAYSRALEEDVCPLRMLPRVARRFRDVAAAADIPFVDTDSVVRKLSPQEIPGYDAYIDHVHPTIASHQVIAAAIVDVLEQHDVIRRARSPKPQQIRRMREKHLSTLSKSYYSNGRRRIGWLENWAQRKRLDREILAVNGRGFMAAALRRLDLHDFVPASENLLMATAMDNSTCAEFVRVAARLFEQGRMEAATWMVSEVRGCDCNDNVRLSLDVAELVLALTRNDPARARQICDRHEDWQTVLKNDSSGWTQQMGDIAHRIAELP